MQAPETADLLVNVSLMETVQTKLNAIIITASILVKNLRHVVKMLSA